jgi:hypothetical protein
VLLRFTVDEIIREVQDQGPGGGGIEPQTLGGGFYPQVSHKVIHRIMGWIHRIFSRPEVPLSASEILTSVSALEGRIEECEARQGMLADRFNRFQNRDGMRQAREAKEGDTTLAAQAAALISAHPGAANSGKRDRMAIWRRK